MGAGTGNYSVALARSGYEVIAIEPSQVMRRQARQHARVLWMEGVAEDLPISSASVDGIVCILVLHHLRDRMRAFAEMRRLCPCGPWVLLTLDPRLSETRWLDAYFPWLRPMEEDLFPPLASLCGELEAASDRTGCVEKFLLPPDLRDRILHSGWNRPEDYLDGTFRAGTSGFRMADPAAVAAGVDELRADLMTGRWNRKYGHFRTRESFDGGFRFVSTTARPAIAR